MKSCRWTGPAFLVLALLAPGVTFADAPAKPKSDAAVKHVLTRAAMKKNGSGVEVLYSVDDSVKVGQAATVVIQFENVTDPAGASARFTADASLTLVGADELRLPAGQTTTLTVRATPASEGIAYINVFTTQNGMTSATAIPVRVGEASPKLRSTGELQKLPAGEAVISMPSR